jgi:beta-glucosidase
MEQQSQPASDTASNAQEAREDYKNSMLDVDQRLADLLDRMTLAEKAGMLFQTMIIVGVR